MALVASTVAENLETELAQLLQSRNANQHPLEYFLIDYGLSVAKEIGIKPEENYNPREIREHRRIIKGRLIILLSGIIQSNPCIALRSSESNDNYLRGLVVNEILPRIYGKIIRDKPIQLKPGRSSDYKRLSPLEERFVGSSSRSAGHAPRDDKFE